MSWDSLLLLASSPMLFGFVSFGWENLRQGIEEQVHLEHAQSNTTEKASTNSECSDSSSTRPTQANERSDAQAERRIQKKIREVMSQFSDYSLF